MPFLGCAWNALAAHSSVGCRLSVHGLFLRGDNWIAEAQDLLANSIGLTLKTRVKTWESIADELWRFVLFSEFVFDLPGSLPLSLADVPQAETHAKPLIEDLCDRIRNDRRTQSLYIDRAEEIEKELDLVNLFEGLS